MFWPILAFELRYHLRRPVTWLYVVILFLLAFSTMASEVYGGSGLGIVKKNSPYLVAVYMTALAAVGQVITVALVGTAVLRDYEYRSHELLFTTRLHRAGYLGGRFAGSFLVMVLVFLAIPVGLAAGTIMPWIEPGTMLPFEPWSYMQPFVLLVVTSVLLISAHFFAVGVLTRSLFAIYVQGIALLVAWGASQQWLFSIENHSLAALLDPFAVTTVSLATRYWTPAEQNALLVPMTGMLLLNRLLWLGVAAALAAAAFAFFRFEAAPRTLRRVRAAGLLARAVAQWRDSGAAASTPNLAARPVAAIRREPAPAAGPALQRSQLWSTTRFAFLRIVGDVPFRAIAAMATLQFMLNAWNADSSSSGAVVWPLTYAVAGNIATGYFLFMVIITTIYAGESIWRERALGAAEFTDSMPVSTAVTAAGKIIGLVLAQLALLMLLVGVGIAVQTFKGYHNYEFGLYLEFVFGATLPWVVAVTLFAFFVHTLASSKFVGHVVLIVYWLTTTVLDNVGFEHQLYRFGMTPSFTYSDMNGFGHFTANLALSAGYWMAVGLMLATVTMLFWLRGHDTAVRARLTEARARWTRPQRLASGGTAFASVIFGGAIFYNTNVLNPYLTKADEDGLMARWEMEWGRFRDLQPPKVVAVEATMELYPERRSVETRGRLVAVNREPQAMDSVLVHFSRGVRVDSLAWSRNARRLIADTAANTFLYVLAEPLAPGDSIELHYAARHRIRGFPNARPASTLVGNGSNLTLRPVLGYSQFRELTDVQQRRKLGLPPLTAMTDLDSPAAGRHSWFGAEAEAARVVVTVGTAADQTAVAPGRLEREWEQDGRRYFRYVLAGGGGVPFRVVSARYAVHRDRWNDIEIEIYHHPAHRFNLERMATAAKRSLAQFTAEYGRYPFESVRIVETPRYEGGAEALPGLVPFSEAAGFVMRIRNVDDDLDMPFFVTAHEVAHMWWGWWVTASRAQGSAVLIESMAEYAALTVMEREHGPDHAHKFLRYELDRYLRGRARESERELPLMRAQRQGYVHYSKGALALYALRDYIGEAAMNRALRGMVDEYGGRNQPPFPTSRDLVAHLRAATPDSLQYVITDLFEEITLYDNRIEQATSERLPDGRYLVTLKVHARKLRADSIGNETAVPLADYIEIGVFGEREQGNRLGRPLYLGKHRITAETTTIEVIVDGEPRRAGVDPYNRLIDRVPSDNVRAVTAAGRGGAAHAAAGPGWRAVP
jgi:ABC-2 type transport system permease protein